MIFEGYVKEKKQIAEKTWEVTISHHNDLFYFNAGQYIWVITDTGRQAFSISSSSKDPFNIKIIFRDRNNSEFKKSILMSDSSQKLKLRGPCGVLRIPDEDNKSTYLAGGVGISPLIGILESLSDTGLSRDINLIFVNRDRNFEFYLDKLKEYKNKIKGFKFVNVIGDIPTRLLNNDTIKNSSIYILGSSNFVNVVASILDELKVIKNNIIYEENFPETSNFSVDPNDTSLFRRVVDQSANHVVITDANGHILYANKSAENLTGFTFDEMKGQTPRLWGGEMDPDVYRKLWQTIKIDKKAYKSEISNVKKNGEKYDVIATISPILDSGGNLLGFMGIEEDITQEKRDRIETEKISNLFLDKIANKK